MLSSIRISRADNGIFRFHMDKIDCIHIDNDDKTEICLVLGGSEVKQILKDIAELLE